jgi:long-subunit acyl-CoA synthetase (AMP-forming)
VGDTVTQVLEAAARQHAQRPALRFKQDGAWQTLTWSEYLREVRRTARGFMSLGLRPGQGVVIMGFNRAQWFLADLGAIAAGGLPAGIYQTSTPDQCRYVCQHAQAAVAVVEDARYLELFLSLRSSLPDLRAIVLMNGQSDQPGVMAWDDLLRAGDAVPEAELDARTAAQQDGDCATLIYTSGTTGTPKGVMLSHRNLVWTARQIVTHLQVTHDDLMVSYLPLSHVAEQVLSMHSPMAAGALVTLAESFEALADNLREVRPTFFFGVPRVWEKMQAAMQAAGAQASPLRRRIAAWARRQGLAGGRAEQEGRRPPVLHGLARRLVFDTVRARLGLDRARVCAVSAAPIGVATLEYFLSLGIPILEVYGMSECTGPATMSLPGAYRTGTAGRAIPGTDLRLAADGEILIRGPHVFLGYFRDEAATRETLDDEGWLHSGDVGETDAQGYLRVTDRKKELLITSGGKNVAPQPIETRLRQIPGIGHAVAVGERRHYVAALLTLDSTRVPTVAAQAGSPARDSSAAVACPLFRAYLQRQVEVVNGTLARYESVRRFEVLPEEFTVDGGELTPTLKLKRRVVYQKYADVIERLYEEAG